MMAVENGEIKHDDYFLEEEIARRNNFSDKGRVVFDTRRQYRGISILEIDENGNLPENLKIKDDEKKEESLLDAEISKIEQKNKTQREIIPAIIFVETANEYGENIKAAIERKRKQAPEKWKYAHPKTEDVKSVLESKYGKLQ